MKNWAKSLLQDFISIDFHNFKSIDIVLDAWTNQVFEVTDLINLNWYIKIKIKKGSALEHYLFTKFFKGHFYYDQYSHHLISQKIDVSKPYLINDWFMNNVMNSIKQLQNLNINKNIKVNDFDYLCYLPLVKNDVLAQHFKTIYEQELKTTKSVLAHNDFSINNILANEQENTFVLIDFEYSSKNLKDWDLFNFLRDLEDEQLSFGINYIKQNFKYDDQLIYKYLFLTSYYGYLWAVNAFLKSNEAKIKAYGDCAYQKANYYFQKLNK
ncbi:protein kinase family protein [Ureaplasma urealyticum]|uniref:hypothetical protein n=1 Tax=Ureaplasma urealyticum TaxID=2130 RepID=UPI00307E5A03